MDQVVALVGLQELDFALVVVEQVLERGGQVSEVKAAPVAISQHGSGTVLAGNDDKTATLDVKGIVVVGALHRSRRLDVSERQVSQCRCFEFAR